MLAQIVFDYITRDFLKKKNHKRIMYFLKIMQSIVFNIKL